MMRPYSKRYLVVCTLRIGDVLLTTPVIHAIRLADPTAQIDVMVLRGIEGTLEGNPDINRVIAIPHRAGFFVRLKEILGLWRRYDVALSTVSSDRARWYCFIAGKMSAGLYNTHTAWLSVRLLDKRVLFDDIHTHTVSMGLQVLDLLGIPKFYHVIPPAAGGSFPAELSKGPYAVLHPFPKFSYKMWSQEHWIALIDELARQGIRSVLTGGPAPEEMKYVEQIAKNSGATNLCGALSLAKTADLISRAILFVGPDTGVTHIAAAVGTPTIALFGPSNPVKWGPWPSSYARDESPWHMKGSQQVGNVSLIQGEGDCVPCRGEGCEKNRTSYSKCLDELTVRRVMVEIDRIKAGQSDEI
ncbi:MAG: glycosyltransferase family 9 protein [Betaproteobacteria bacterium]|nr:glycosyltransferase family 9 protein [Betaproteobacteria bacterium]